MTTTITHQLTLTTETCPACHIVFAMPDTFNKARRGDGTSFYCPSGHTMSYNANREKILQDQLAEAERKARAAKCEALNAQAKAAELEKAAERNKKRLHAGVCPCCNRTFQNLARHMKTKHSKA